LDRLSQRQRNGGRALSSCLPPTHPPQGKTSTPVKHPPNPHLRGLSLSGDTRDHEIRGNVGFSDCRIIRSEEVHYPLWCSMRRDCLRTSKARGKCSWDSVRTTSGGDGVPLGRRPPGHSFGASLGTVSRMGAMVSCVTLWYLSLTSIQGGSNDG
jgi:hypothetical protein